MDLATENQVLRTILVVLTVVLSVVLAFSLASRKFFTSLLRAAELARASNTLVVNALDAATVEWEALVGRLPPVDEAAIAELWRLAIETTPKLELGGRERVAYHPVLLHVLELITARTHGRLRLHREATIALDGREPDICWTPDREAYATGVSTLSIFEIKTIRAALDASPQLHGYMYYALSEKQKLLPWWSWLTGWSVALYGAGCTALEIRFESLVSTRDGVELRTTNYMPFVPWVTHALGSLERHAAVSAGVPTPGFRALVRILLAPPALLGQVRNPQPPAQSMYLEGVRGSPVVVNLGDLLGGGSFGNAFRATCPSIGGGLPVDAVVKIYRDPFRGHLGGHKQLRTELSCLRAIMRLDEHSVHLPTLLAASATALVESPCGTPLPVRLRQLAVAAGIDAPQHRTFAALRNAAMDGALAWGVYDGVLRGLRVLHGIGWLHCDVRLPNCVVLRRAALGLVGPTAKVGGVIVTESAVLIDLGCALQLVRAVERPGCYKVAMSGLTFWHDLRGALSVFVESAIGGRYSLQSALWGKDMLDDDIVRSLKPPRLAAAVSARRNRINDHISSALKSIQQVGRIFGDAPVAVAPGAADYVALRV
jgi:hypothetical protein